jgi:hypothetical protein
MVALGQELEVRDFYAQTTVSPEGNKTVWYQQIHFPRELLPKDLPKTGRIETNISSVQV